MRKFIDKNGNIYKLKDFSKYSNGQYIQIQGKEIYVFRKYTHINLFIQNILRILQNIISIIICKLQKLQ